MTNQRYPILTIRTTAKASSGKKSMTAKATLMIISAETAHRVRTGVSVICAKLSNEEYIVTSGPTNPLDLSTRLESVMASASFWNRIVHPLSPSAESVVSGGVDK